MTQATGPRDARASSTDTARRTLAAVAVSALVAVGVAAPMAWRVLDEADATDPPTTEPTASTQPATTATTSTTTTVPVSILGATTIREDDESGG